MRSIEIYGGPADETLLHADANIREVSDNTVNFMFAEFRRLNPDKPEPDRLLCGGCVLSVLRNMILEVLVRADADDPTAERVYQILGTDPLDTGYEGFVARLIDTLAGGRF